MRRRRNLEIIAGRVNADGTVAVNDGQFNVTGSAGVYIITFAPGFRLISATASASAIAMIDTWTGTSMRVVTVTTVGGAAAAAPFSFIAVGTQ